MVGSQASPPVAAILYLPEGAHSVRYRPYLEAIGPVSFLEWLVDRFLRCYPEIPLHILFRHDSEPAAVSDILRDKRVEIVRSAHRALNLALADAAKGLPRSQLVVLTVAWWLSPDDLLRRLYAHHVGSGNNYTPVVGLPADTAPVLYDPELLIALVEPPRPAHATGPAAQHHCPAFRGKDSGRRATVANPEPSLPGPWCIRTAGATARHC